MEKVEKVLNNLCERLTNELDYLKGPVELLGVNSLGDHGMTMRMTVETEVMKHYGIQRKILREVKIEFDKNKITIPFPQVVVHNAK